MGKNPNSRPKPVKRDEPMTSAMKFFLCGCVAELYLLVVRRFYINGTLEQVVSWDSYLNYLLYAGVAVAVVGVILSAVWHKRPSGAPSAGASWLRCVPGCCQLFDPDLCGRRGHPFVRSGPRCNAAGDPVEPL